MMEILLVTVSMVYIVQFSLTIFSLYLPELDWFRPTTKLELLKLLNPLLPYIGLYNKIKSLN